MNTKDVWLSNEQILALAYSAREEAVNKGDWMAVIRLGGLISLVRKDLIDELQERLNLALDRVVQDHKEVA